MPLNPLTLADGIREFTDPDFAGFTGLPQNTQDVGIKWAKAFKKYMIEIANPPPGAGTIAGHSAGESAMASTMSGIITPLPPTGLIAIQAGALAYVLAFSATTAPIISIPPPVPLILPPTPPTPAPIATIQMATIIDLWVRTGLSSVPPAPPIPWL